MIASRIDPVGKRGRHRLTKRRSVASFGPAEEVGVLASAAAGEWGATEARRQVVLGEGAPWITTQAHEQFPDAVKILEWPPRFRNVRDAIRALHPGKRADRRAWRKQQHEVLFSLRWQGQREQAVASR